MALSLRHLLHLTKEGRAAVWMKRVSYFLQGDSSNLSFYKDSIKHQYQMGKKQQALDQRSPTIHIWETYCLSLQIKTRPTSRRSQKLLRFQVLLMHRKTSAITLSRWSLRRLQLRLLPRCKVMPPKVHLLKYQDCPNLFSHQELI